MQRPDREPRYAVGPFVVDVGAVEVRHHEELVPMEPQVFQVLVVLLRERDRVVTKLVPDDARAHVELVAASLQWAEDLRR